MIVYRIDKNAQVKASTDIRSMASGLAEISPKLQTLRNAIAEQESGITTPNIKDFREQLQRRINEAIGLTTAISEDSQKLIAVSDQAAKHVLAIEEQVGTVLHSKSSTTQAQVQ